MSSTSIVDPSRQRPPRGQLGQRHRPLTLPLSPQGERGMLSADINDRQSSTEQTFPPIAHVAYNLQLAARPQRRPIIHSDSSHVEQR
jgi:hypothetical protein